MEMLFFVMVLTWNLWMKLSGVAIQMKSIRPNLLVILFYIQKMSRVKTLLLLRIKDKNVPQVGD